MAIKNRNTIKQWFKTFDYPTQEQFWDLIDSMFNLAEDQMPINNIQGLAELLGGKAEHATVQGLMQRLIPSVLNYNNDGSYDIPAQLLLEKIVVLPQQNLVGFKIGSAEGLDDIYPATDIAAGSALTILLDVYAGEIDKSIFLAGLLANTKIIFYKR